MRPTATPRGAAVPAERHAAGRRLTRRFFDRPVLEVAPELLGCIVARTSPEGTVSVRLTEVEAYDGENDPGSHAFRGATPRNEVMFGPSGHIYVYFTYGMHWCMNVVCGPPGQASAVLLRAGEVVAGEQLAQARRPSARSPRELARGPARRTSALGVDRADNGADALDLRSPLRLLPGIAVAPDQVRTGPRVGVAGAGASTPWRFWLDGEPTVSAYRPAIPRRRGGATSGRL
ncbi:MAG: DNA-3-methyladenine glycosylase [Actinomycetota bacterium]|nr:DNA-3-methyladenine glycosylase [Actinomycetota bacterium]